MHPLLFCLGVAEAKPKLLLKSSQQHQPLQ
jgi:hypothetical protein